MEPQAVAKLLLPLKPPKPASRLKALLLLARIVMKFLDIMTADADCLFVDFLRLRLFVMIQQLQSLAKHEEDEDGARNLRHQHLT
ncbi:unnamed protein product [Protopolystoma xenopodis]|uniref:Uncharacterized protein n=1 Tax=Protopolystoma xenopodis TaxID=117903 RepID=A0A3S5FBX2_9PLAT|nr:unnamed protein product [Protopolystoma xenopodis]